MKFSKHIYLVPASLLLFSASCSDSGWTPGPEDKYTGVTAYFAPDTKTSFVFEKATPTEDLHFEIPVYRQISDAAASVPITITSDAQGLTVPKTVDFEAGEKEGTISIDCSGIPESKLVKFTIALDPAQTDIYVDGLNDLSATVIKSDWLQICDKVRYLYTDMTGEAMFPATYGNMYQLEGTFTFKFDNFFGSGLDMTFDCDTPSRSVMKPNINADYNVYYPEDQADLGWYLYDEKNVDYPEWIPGDLEGYNAITLLMFYSSKT